MPRFVRRLAAAALLALPLVSLSSLEARSGPATPGDPPDAVKQAIAKSAADDKIDDPAKVVVGAYINDIQQLDFKATTTPSTSMSGSAGRAPTSILPRPWSS